MSAPTASELEQLRTELAELTAPEPPAIVVVNRRGFVVHVDAALAEALGWRPDEIVAHPLTMMIPPRFRDAHHLGFSRFLATGRAVMMGKRLRAFTVLHRTGRELAAELVIIASSPPAGLLFAAAVRVDSP